MQLPTTIIVLTLASVLTPGTASILKAPLSPCSAPAVLDAGANVWKDHKLHVDPYYQASKIADFGTFIWLRSEDNIQDLRTTVAGVPCDEIVGLVLDNLPYKGSDTKGSGFNMGTLTEYRNFIDLLAEVISASRNTSFAVIVEPRAYPNYLNDTGASDKLAKSYRENTPYALRALDLPNVVTYLDVGNSNSMDWGLHRSVAAKEILSVYGAAGSPHQFRGFATNVANFNSWGLLPGEFATGDDSRYVRPQNEQHFVRILSDALRENGLPARATHAIIDTSRSGVSGLRYTWDDWCNIKGAGFGIRPTSQTGDETLDAFVWVKHPGESDGTSNSSEPGYDEFCGKDDAVKPSPGSGLWHQAYFEMLVRNADPSL
ncbi:glycoside hydrolase family 6 protein [Daldinia bambusicola]|nr:glycoside hydrolase family 6 protein [Daldinia bambusicola]